MKQLVKNFHGINLLYFMKRVFYAIQILTTKVDPRTVRVKIFLDMGFQMKTERAN